MREGRNGGKLKSGNTKNVGRKKELPRLSEILINSLSNEKDGVTDAFGVGIHQVLPEALVRALC